MLAIVLGLAVFSSGMNAKAGGPGAPVEIEGAQEHLLASSVNGETYRILVWQPSGKAPPEGYPVVYAFDGDRHFGHLSDSARELVFRSRRTGLHPAIVVGIGYPKGQYTLARRNFDLTPPAERYEMPVRPNGQPWPKMGGGEAFLDTVERDIKPFVRLNYPVNPERASLFGHSFGGMMVLHSLFNRDDGYRNYIAASPSIWFNAKQVYRDAAARLATGKPDARVPVSLRISVGANEQTLGEWERSGSARDIERRRSWLDANRMVDNAREFAELVLARGGGRVRVDLDVIPDEGHGSVVPAAVYRGLWFAVNN